MVFLETPQDDSALSFVKRGGFWKRLGGNGSATQLLWAKWERDESLYELSARQPPSTQQATFILDQCRQKLALARRCIDKKKRWSSSFWELIHEVDGLLLLVMPLELLLPEALRVLQKFEQKVTDPVLRRLWLGLDGTSGPLPKAVRRLTRAGWPAHGFLRPRRLSEEQVSRYRHVLRGALGTVNEMVDKAFWQMSINVSIQILSTLLMVTLFSVLFVFPWIFPQWGAFESDPRKFIPRDLLRISLLGAGGATLSNMLAKEHFVVATGASARYFFYYLLVKPVIGSFAALFLFYLEISGILLQVVILPESGGHSTANFQIVVASPEAAFFARAALAVVAGFFADRLLTNMMDKVLDQLLKQSETMMQPSAPKREARGLSRPGRGEPLLRPGAFTGIQRGSMRTRAPRPTPSTPAALPSRTDTSSSPALPMSANGSPEATTW